MQYSFDNVRLDDHHTARNQARASRRVASGTVVLRVPSLCTSLILAEKGRRCDHCHRLPTSDSRLSKCSGCAAYWYCGSTCQTAQWRAHHRKICKRVNRFTASSGYAALEEGQKVDAMLLSHFFALVFPNDDFTIPPTSGDGNPHADAITTFFDLLKGRIWNPHIPLCRASSTAVPQTVFQEVLGRFGNNNFVLHSHLSSFAHGVFPLASRLFNHSCAPNCAAKYIVVPMEPITMEVVALRDIASGEELTLPYLDPAIPLETRGQVLQHNYGFSCGCPLCTFQRSMPRTLLSEIPSEDNERLHMLEDRLCSFVNARLLPLDPGPPEVQAPARADDAFNLLPIETFPLVLSEQYLPNLAEEFSSASHDGPFDIALRRGRILLALYAVIYPQNYPQIGMHALELTKTAWNAVVTAEAGGGALSALDAKAAEELARHYLRVAAHVLEMFGPEGDEGGPLEEVRVMREMLQDQ